MSSMQKISAGLLVLVFAFACSSEATRRAAYEAAYRKSCLDRGAQADCDPGHLSYEEYRKQHQDPDQAVPTGR